MPRNGLENLADLAAGGPIGCDVCIVGSGPAGATLAFELADTSLRVVLVESGRETVDRSTEGLSAIENVGAFRDPNQSVMRRRILGGASHDWNGRCATLDGIDFQSRPWVPHSGWPIAAEQLTPFLERSAPHLGLGLGSDYTGERFWTLTAQRRPARALPGELLPMFWQLSRDPAHGQAATRFGPRLRLEQPANLRILTNATVVHVNTDEAASEVRSVEVASPDDRRFVIAARTVVLCAGGIENARLLLASDRLRPNGLGNDRDLVGRFLMDHPRGVVGAFGPEQVGELAPHLGLRTARTPRGFRLFCQGLRLSPAVQAREELLNCAVWLSEHIAPDDPWTALKRLAQRRGGWRDGVTILSHPSSVAEGVCRTVWRGGSVPRRLKALELVCAVEQRPDPDSRVTLAGPRDRHGVPISRVDWRVSEQERRTVRRTATLAAEALGRSGVRPPALADWVRDGGPFPRDFRDAAHHIGTTRMSDDPSTGVVDPDCQVHGVRGLFVAGSSVFPTGGHANPTQMIVALAIRLADRIRARERLAQPTAARVREPAF
jgi:choline dehydrogenase-like flavoprotein